MLLLCGLTACAHWPGDQLSSTEEPDKVLYERAVLAAQRGRLDVAALTLQTLINTYPDSPYSQKAEAILQDTRFSVCSGSMTFFAIGQGSEPPVATSEDNLPLEFFETPSDKP